jgi:hypothetical protein
MEREIIEAFNGWTVAGEVKGSYRMSKTGKKQVDRLLHVWVAVEKKVIPQLKEMVARFGALLGQEAMYFEVSESRVELIPPSTEEATNGEEKGEDVPGRGKGR